MEKKKNDVARCSSMITYSTRYEDNEYEYRHVTLPRELLPYVPKKLMTEQECRELGVTQSPGWEHYMIHNPEPHVLLFRRKRTK